LPRDCTSLAVAIVPVFGGVGFGVAQHLNTVCRLGWCISTFGSGDSGGCGRLHVGGVPSAEAGGGFGLQHVSPFGSADDCGCGRLHVGGGPSTEAGGGFGLQHFSFFGSCNGCGSGLLAVDRGVSTDAGGLKHLMHAIIKHTIPPNKKKTKKLLTAK